MSFATRLKQGIDNYNAIHELEHHFHGGARWLGATAAPPGGGVGPGLIDSLNAFRATTHATASTFGTAIVVFDGTEDFTKSESVVYFDPHEIFILNAEQSATYKIRFANSQWNGSEHTYANMAAAVTAKKFTDLVIKCDSTNSEATVLNFMSGRMRAGSILWAQVMKNSADAKYLEFLVGVHTYPDDLEVSD